MNALKYFFPLLIFFCIVGNLFADDFFFSQEFDFNSGNNNAYKPKVASNKDNYLVVWDKNADIYARLMSKNGSFLTDEFCIKAKGSNFRCLDPTVGTDGTNYFVVWHHDINFGTQVGLRGQFVDNNGLLIGPEIVVKPDSSSPTPYLQDIASNGSNYLVIWSIANDTHGQFFDMNGNAINTEFRINASTAGQQREGSVASNGNTYMVAWSSDGDPNSLENVYGQMYGSTGSPLGSNFRISTTTGNNIENFGPEVWANGSIYVVVWQYNDSYIHERKYDTAGNPIGTEISISDSGTTVAEISGNNNGFFVCRGTHTATFNLDIYGQFLDANGFSYGGVFPIAFSINNLPSTASSGNEYLLVWQTSGKSDIKGKLLYRISNDIVISQQPESSTIYEGEDVSFSISAYSNNGQIDYCWYKNGNIIGTNSDTLLITNVQIADNDAAIYCDIIDNKGIKRSDSATLTVQEPSFTISIEGPDKIFGSNTANYNAKADYGSGNIYVVTDYVVWTVTPDTYVSISSSGQLTTVPVTTSQIVTVRATLSEGSETHWSDFSVLIDPFFQVVSMTPAPESTVTSAPFNIILNLSANVSPSTVNGSTCILTKAGHDGLFGTSDDTLIPVFPIFENPAQINLDISDSLLPNDLYQIKLIGVKNENNTSLDGEYTGSLPSGNDIPGGDFSATFTIERRITSMTILNDNDTVTLTWAPFRDGTVYRVDFTDDLVNWAPVEPIAQWPINTTTWTGSSWQGYDNRFFMVVGVVPYVKNISPTTGVKGTYSLQADIYGYGTNWTDANITVNFGEGITVNSVLVENPSHIVVEIRISLTADLGFRDVIITTDEKVYIKENGFEVTE